MIALAGLLPVAAAIVLATVIVGLIAHTRDQGDRAEGREWADDYRTGTP